MVYFCPCAAELFSLIDIVDQLETTIITTLNFLANYNRHKTDYGSHNKKDFLANYNRHKTGYGSHNKKEQKKNLVLLQQNEGLMLHLFVRLL